MANNQEKSDNQIEAGVAGGGGIQDEMSLRRNVWGGHF
jgi:hypothetical protein